VLPPEDRRQAVHQPARQQPRGRTKDRRLACPKRCSPRSGSATSQSPSAISALRNREPDATIALQCMAETPKSRRESKEQGGRRGQNGKPCLHAASLVGGRLNQIGLMSGSKTMPPPCAQQHAVFTLLTGKEKTKFTAVPGFFILRCADPPLYPVADRRPVSSSRRGGWRLPLRARMRG